MVTKYMFEELSTINIVAGMFVILCALLLGLISFMYFLKNIRILRVVKNNGRCVSSVPLMINIKKNSFINMYSIVNFLLSCIALLVLVSSLTYSILQFAYFASISFYLPILILISVSGFNSVYHLNTEMKIIQTVREFHTVF